MKATKPWKVSVNGQEYFVEAIKSTTAIDYALNKYLMGKRTSFLKLLDSHFLDYATVTIEPVIISKKEATVTGKQLSLVKEQSEVAKQ
jgi:hypothetical protein